MGCVRWLVTNDPNLISTPKIRGHTTVKVPPTRRSLSLRHALALKSFIYTLHFGNEQDSP